MIRVENLTKYYGNLRGVTDISFRVEEGEVLGFLGPNGAGKSTTMRILTGYMPAKLRFRLGGGHQCLGVAAGGPEKSRISPGNQSTVLRDDG